MSATTCSLLLLIFVTLSAATATSDGVILLQTHASIINSESGVAFTINGEIKSFARRVMEGQEYLTGSHDLHRSHAPVSLNKDIQVLADAPGFRKQTNERPNIFFVHNNKCGGAALCYIAQANGERSPVGPNFWGCETPHKDGEEIDEAQIDAATFVETQGIAPDTYAELKAANDTILMTVMRDPITRLVSEWRHYGYRWDPKNHGETERADWTDHDPRRDDMEALMDYHSTHDPETLYSDIGASDLEGAIKALRGYDLVLITEDLDAIDLARLKTIGWTSLDSGEEEISHRWTSKGVDWLRQGNTHTLWDMYGDPEPGDVVNMDKYKDAKWDIANWVREEYLIQEGGHVNAGSTLGAGNSSSAYDQLGPERINRLEKLFAADVALYKAAVEIAKEQRLVQLQ